METFFGKFKPIENSKNYIPGKGELERNDTPIIALHITKQLKGIVRIYNMQGQPTIFPPTAFVPGGVYNYPTSRIDYTDPDDDCSIIGCMVYRRMPRY